MKHPLIAPEEIELYQSQSNTRYIILMVVIVAVVAGLIWFGNMGAHAVEFMDVYGDAIR